jgi:hypothetical protein
MLTKKIISYETMRIYAHTEDKQSHTWYMERNGSGIQEKQNKYK